MKGVYGYDFSDHKVVEVPASDSLATRKLTANSHFEIVTGEPIDESVKEIEPGKEIDKGSCVHSEENHDPDFQYGVFRVKEDTSLYSKPDKMCESAEEAELYIGSFDDGKKRKVMKKPRK